jgi:hypothetical protein
MRNFGKGGLLVGLLVISASATAQPAGGSQPNQANASQAQMMGQGQMMGRGLMTNHAEMQRHMDVMHQSCTGMMSQMSATGMGMRYNGQPRR